VRRNYYSKRVEGRSFVTDEALEQRLIEYFLEKGWD
jgi:hypothetical protein